MKGVILAGGKGTRLRPATFAMNKHMVPILNRPMILYPLDTLKQLGVTDIMIVSGGNHIGSFADFLGDGTEHGVELTYRVQTEAGGIAQALALAADFVNGDQVAVILGDNIFAPFDDILLKSIADLYYPQIFIKSVKDPQRFGVVSIDRDTGVHSIEEKPEFPKSDKAVTGLYIYPPNVFEMLPGLVPSARGELEITDVNNEWIKRKEMVAHDIGDAFWSDAGTPDSLAAVTKWAHER